jgi:hypothetical protein
MIFLDSQDAISMAELQRLEAVMSLVFPEPVKLCYLESNGGSPSPYVFTNDDIDTIVSEFLPLKSTTSGTAVESYRRLVLVAKLVPRSLFPFAVDGGGDYFFVDCASPSGRVYFYRSDTNGTDPLVDLRLGFQEFWESLKPE